MNFDLQPILENELIRIVPLKTEDYNTLYEIASDPSLWEQHPNKDRYKPEVFKTLFEGAMESGGAFLVYDNENGKAIGSSRYYNIKNKPQCIAIGYTFIAKDHWGTTYNRALKKLMLEHAFKFVDTVLFHIGVDNIRSQKAILKLGAVKVDEVNIRYYGEKESKNFIYRIEKNHWANIKDS